MSVWANSGTGWAAGWRGAVAAWRREPESAAGGPGVVAGTPELVTTPWLDYYTREPVTEEPDGVNDPS